MHEVDFQASTLPLPADIQRLIDDADKRIDELIEARLDRPLTGFVPCEFGPVYNVLKTLATTMDPRCFVEWGSGFGVVTMMAKRLGFDAAGIEIEPDLVQAAEELARDHKINAEFVSGSFVPRAAQSLIDEVDWPNWLECGGVDGHDLLDLDPRDVDLVFAYPWPGESHVIESIFDMICESGSMLLTWNGIEEIRLLRKA